MKTTTLLAAALSFLLAACGDEMAPPKPCAAWPVTITAGVNDKIDFVIEGAPYVATIAAGTYTAPTDLAEAVRLALTAAYAPIAYVVSAGVNDTMRFVRDAAPHAAVIAPGSYGRAGLATAIVAAMEAVDPVPFWQTTIDPAPYDMWIVNDVRPWSTVVGAASAWPGLGVAAPAASSADGEVAGSVPFGAAAWSVSVSNDGRATVSVSGGPAFVLKFATGANADTSARDVLGFGAVDTLSATSATGAHQMEGCWFGADPVASDDFDRPSSILRSQTRSLSGKVRTRTFGVQYDREIVLAFLEPHKVFISEEGTSHVNEALERLFLYGAERFRWFPDQTDLSTYADYALDAGTKFAPRRLSPGAALYTQSLRLLRYVT